MPKPFDAYAPEHLELYEWFKHFHPQWWKEVDAKDLIGIKVTRDNLSEQFPVNNISPSEWNDLWNILVVRQSAGIY
ncbi:hypothetical protein SBP1_gp013 [Vibrio virus vB_VspP_SBP1]|uniref:Uncharacterized protein n=1 Tax=Vibrio virus vB_VspP_SBP1 TaxID=2500581 RepID=A0A3T0IIE7_9CAUD|nr:hypothetical protein KNU36_gp013 [Vibrio virus vB_VspP_SBP1]AZU99605.1 hypothetical protein SBP1_gp013 [Vibrio virus vB_VspP_SBP1]